MPSFTVFNIGTGHTKKETDNVLVKLYEDTNAHALDLERGDGDWRAASDVKVINDGPTTLRPNDYMDRHATAVASSVLEWATGKENPVVNLVGHSRGAIMCVMMANRMDPYARCNVFLIDPVNMSGHSEENARILRDNTSNVCRITMEDDQSGTFFPLQAVGYERGVGASHTIAHYRLPGKHGTATQCNLIPFSDENIPKWTRSLGDVWPIGAATRLLILRKLQSWGSPLHAGASAEVRDDASMIDEYSRIVRTNVVASRSAPIQVRVNDVEGGSQTYKSICGTRSTVNLDEIGGLNPFRAGPVFVNQDHSDLFRALWPDLHAEVLIAIDRFNAGGPKHEMYLRADARISRQWEELAARALVTFIELQKYIRIIVVSRANADLD